MNVALWLGRAAALHPKAPALLTGTNVVANYAEFEARVASIAAGFREIWGISRGDRVAILMSNRIEYLEVMYAAWYVGAAIVPINAKLHVKEAAWMIENSEAKLAITAQTSVVPLTALVNPDATQVIDVESAAFSALYDMQPIGEPLALGGDALAWLFYTSGTTGRPKGVMITHQNLEMMALTYFVDVDAVQSGDAILYAAPMSHGAGFYNFMFVMRGARHVVPESGGFDAAELAAIAPTIGNCCMFAAPTMIRRMIAEAKQTGYRGEGFKTIVYGGGPMYIADILDAVDIFGSRFAQIYGQGESPMTITALSKDLVADRTNPNWRQRLGSVGRAQSCIEVKIVDQCGEDCARGQVGEILVRGATVMAGYFRNDAATLETVREGWLWTGDIGTMDGDGFVTLHDRSKDLVISGGTNIYPREVEEVLLEHPSVAQAAVIGQADPEWGEVVVAFVVIEDGQTCDAETLDAHCVGNIARFKRPKRYVFVNDLPKNAYGKVLKTELRSILNPPAMQ